MVTQSNHPNHSGSAVLACTLLKKVLSDLAKISMQSQLIFMQKQSNFYYFRCLFRSRLKEKVFMDDPHY